MPPQLAAVCLGSGSSICNGRSQACGAARPTSLMVLQGVGGSGGGEGGRGEGGESLQRGSWRAKKATLGEVWEPERLAGCSWRQWRHTARACCSTGVGQHVRRHQPAAAR